jgi:hypothetical protein
MSEMFVVQSSAVPGMTSGATADNFRAAPTDPHEANTWQLMASGLKHAN